jgi:D-alanyl-D-alanine endopeptidase (penicillin-binding protein 7)
MVFSKYKVQHLAAGLLCLLMFSDICARPNKIPAPTLSYALWNVDTGEHLYSSNESNVRPMASITKLMSVLVVMRGELPLDEELTVTGKESSNRIKSGMRIARSRLIELALVSSDNLATRTLAETYPGGYSAFIQDMNRTAADLGMSNTHYDDATGLLGSNISTAEDIRKLVLAVSPLAIITQAANTARLAFSVSVPRRNKAREVVVQGSNTNNFVGKLDIIAAKTGYTSRAGRCLTMLFNYNGSKYLLVVMGAKSTQHRSMIVNELIDKIR